MSEREFEPKGMEVIPPGSPAAELARVMSWRRAFGVGLAVLGYFVVFTVWIPSTVAQLEAIESSAPWIQDLAVTGSWAVALSVGLVGLRRSQRAGWI